MPLNFLNPVKQEYVSEYIPAPIKEIADTGEVLQNRYDVVTDKFDKLRALAKNKRSLAGDKSVVDNAIGKIEEQFKTYSKSGNFEDADFVVNQLATDFLTDKELQDAEMSYKGYQERDAAIKKYGKSALDFAPIDPATYSTSKQGVYSPRVEERKDWEQRRFSFFDNIPVTGFDGKTKSLSAVEAEKKGYPGMSVTERSSQMGITPNRIAQRANEALPNYLNTEEGIQEYEALVAIDGQTPAQARETIKQRMIKSGLERTGLVTKTEYLENAANRGNTQGQGPENPFDLGTWTQRRSAEFLNSPAKAPFEVDQEGDIKMTTKKTGSSGLALEAGSALLADFYGLNKDKDLAKQINTENSVPRKRLINFLEERGILKPGLSKKEQNEAISNFWNEELAIAQASIAVPMPGDKASLDVVEQMNRAYFGTTDPNVPAKGTSILAGQAAQASFTDERGQVLTPAMVATKVKDKNVRVNGFVKDYRAPFEYGSPYMVATDPKSQNTEHFLISPDDNTKNSGGYFANRIYNSTRQKDLVTQWNDGFGNSYESTPVKGGAGFLLYVNGDKTTPIPVSQRDLQTLSSYGPEVIELLANKYKSLKKESK